MSFWTLFIDSKKKRIAQIILSGNTIRFADLLFMYVFSE